MGAAGPAAGSGDTARNVIQEGNRRRADGRACGGRLPSLFAYGRCRLLLLLLQLLLLRQLLRWRERAWKRERERERKRGGQ